MKNVLSLVFLKIILHLSCEVQSSSRKIDMRSQGLLFLPGYIAIRGHREKLLFKMVANCTLRKAHSTQKQSYIQNNEATVV